MHAFSTNSTEAVSELSWVSTSFADIALSLLSASRYSRYHLKMKRMSDPRVISEFLLPILTRHRGIGLIALELICEVHSPLDRNFYSMSFVLEDQMRLSHSVIWTWMKNYYDQQGIEGLLHLLCVLIVNVLNSLGEWRSSKLRDDVMLFPNQFRCFYCFPQQFPHCKVVCASHRCLFTWYLRIEFRGGFVFFLFLLSAWHFPRFTSRPGLNVFILLSWALGTVALGLFLVKKLNFFCLSFFFSFFFFSFLVLQRLAELSDFLPLLDLRACCLYFFHIWRSVPWTFL